MNEENYSQPYQYETPGERTLEYQLDVDELIERMEHILKGEKIQYNQKKKQLEWVANDKAKKKINERGISSALVILNMNISKITVLSDLEEEHINTIASDVGHDLIEDIYANWDEYEIPDASAARIVVNTVMNAVIASLRKAYRGKTLDMIKTTNSTREIQTYTMNSQEESDNGPTGLKRLFKSQ